ncbi:MAG: hypothetical protein ACRDRY_11570 [Pseudonocardiaceae bacterium]
MTDRADVEDAALPESAPSLDIRLPLTTVEPERRGDPASEATRSDGVPLAVLGPVPRRTR